MVSICLATIGFHVICYCSHYKRAIGCQSGLAKNRISASSLNEAETGPDMAWSLWRNLSFLSTMLEFYIHFFSFNPGSESLLNPEWILLEPFHSQSLLKLQSSSVHSRVGKIFELEREQASYRTSGCRLRCSRREAPQCCTWSPDRSRWRWPGERGPRPWNCLFRRGETVIAVNCANTFTVPWMEPLQVKGIWSSKNQVGIGPIFT